MRDLKITRAHEIFLAAFPTPPGANLNTPASVLGMSCEELQCCPCRVLPSSRGTDKERMCGAAAAGAVGSGAALIFG